MVRTHCNPNRTNQYGDVSDPEARLTFKSSDRPKAPSKKAGKYADKDPYFGYKVHMVADAIYDIPLAQIVTPANVNDSPMLPVLMEKAAELYSWWNPKVALADRGYDSLANHKWLDDRGITSIIHIRKPSPKTKASSGLYSGLYDEKGRPHCVGMVPMEYQETDPKTGHHLFRCRAQGLPPEGDKRSWGAPMPG